MKERKIFTNGKIFTSNPEAPYATGMIVEDGMILWVGDMKDMPQMEGTKVDLGGKRVIPGIVDAHMHPTMLAEYSKKISSLPPKINSIAELSAEIAMVHQSQDPNKWIEGWGYDEGKLEEKRSPNRYDLDKGSPDAPVMVARTCGHIRCVNSKVLEMAGITKDTPDPQGGEIDRDENGEPTGILRESARNLMTHLMPVPTHEEVVENIVDLGKLLASQGVTAVCDMGNLDRTDSYDDYNEAARQGFKQKVGIYYMWEYYADNDKMELTEEKMDRKNQIFQAGLKLIGDGSVSGKTAWMDKPYLGDEEEYGMPVCSDELIESAIKVSKEKGCQISMHAMGGRAIDRIVDRVYGEDKWSKGEFPHLRIEHVTEPSVNTMKRCAEKGIAFATQPIFIYAEIESYVKNLGTPRLYDAYPIADMLNTKVPFCFSSDAPATSWATPSDPFPGIKGAVTRKAYDGTDCGERHKVDVETALRLYTKSAAEVAGFHNLGQLKEGYQGDFVILSEDILEIPSEKIDQVKVDETYILGEKIYEREERTPS